MRWGWGLLLGFSVVFNLLVSVGYYADAYNDLGIRIAQWRGARGDLGHTSRHCGSTPIMPRRTTIWGSPCVNKVREEAIAQYQQALRIKPDFAEAHYNLGAALAQTGKTGKPFQYEQALQLDPTNAEAHYDLGNVFAQATPGGPRPRASPRGREEARRRDKGPPQGARRRRRRCAGATRGAGKSSGRHPDKRDVDLLSERIARHKEDSTVAFVLKNLGEEREEFVDRTRNAAWKLFEHHPPKLPRGGTCRGSPGGPRAPSTN